MWSLAKELSESETIILRQLRNNEKLNAVQLLAASTYYANSGSAALADSFLKLHKIALIEEVIEAAEEQHEKCVRFGFNPSLHHAIIVKVLRAQFAKMKIEYERYLIENQTAEQASA